MGDRAQVLIFEEYYENGELSYFDKPIHLYTHWGGYNIENTLANALKRGKSRWSDPSYLIRIIISEFVKGDIEGETGIGISRNYQDSSTATDIELYAGYSGDKQRVETPDGAEHTYEEFVNLYAAL